MRRPHAKEKERDRERERERESATASERARAREGEVSVITSKLGALEDVSGVVEVAYAVPAHELPVVGPFLPQVVGCRV